MSFFFFLIEVIVLFHKTWAGESKIPHKRNNIQQYLTERFVKVDKKNSIVTLDWNFYFNILICETKGL